MLKRIIATTLRRRGWALHRIPRPAVSRPKVIPSHDRIQYACGHAVLAGWLNVDIMPDGAKNDYMYVDLVNQHPFPDNHFSFAFCEDFIEHIDQADSIVFLAEVYRTLKPGGVFRLTFPCLERVLEQHFGSVDFKTYADSRSEVFAGLGHIHYYSYKSLALVADHIGFDVVFVEVGQSVHPELQGINTRIADVNLHAELKKRIQ